MIRPRKTPTDIPYIGDPPAMNFFALARCSSKEWATKRKADDPEHANAPAR